MKNHPLLFTMTKINCLLQFLLFKTLNKYSDFKRLSVFHIIYTSTGLIFHFLMFIISIFSGQLFSRSCIPGALDKDYNPSQKPINLCEGCQGGGYRKCQRNSDELYYGATGAFRCLVESTNQKIFNFTFYFLC